MFENYPDVLTVKDLMQVLGIGRNTAYKLLRENQIQSKHIGNKYFIPKQYLIEFVLT